jgi:hypothetical protein
MLNISSLLLIALSCISTHAIADTSTCKDDCNTSTTATISKSTPENTDSATDASTQVEKNRYDSNSRDDNTYDYTNEDSPDGSY